MKLQGKIVCLSANVLKRKKENPSLDASCPSPCRCIDSVSVELDISLFPVMGVAESCSVQIPGHVF